MKNAFAVAVAALVLLCAGCSSKLNESDVTAVLTENVPANLKSLVMVGSAVTEVSSSGDEATVKFKTQLKLSQPLFQEIGFDAIAKSANGETSLFSQVEEASRGLAPADRESLAESIQKATFKPTFIAQKSPVGTAADWYGSFKSKKVIDKWVSSEFITNVAPNFEGRPRSEFKETAIENVNANVWFAEAKARQLDLLQKIDTAKKLVAKDAEIAEAKLMAESEREAKEAVVIAAARQARTMPVELTTRRALMGGTLVLTMNSTRPMTVRLEVARALQHFTHEYQLVPGRPKQVGHLEGWGFMSGDEIRLSNPAFDPKLVTIP